MSQIMISASSIDVRILGDLPQPSKSRELAHFFVLKIDGVEVLESVTVPGEPLEWKEQNQIQFAPASKIEIAIHRKSNKSQNSCALDTSSVLERETQRLASSPAKGATVYSIPFIMSYNTASTALLSLFLTILRTCACRRKLGLVARTNAKGGTLERRRFFGSGAGANYAEGATQY
ncbi:hypothetical protein FIBSPDRAFT_938814 [Athelia psychrophila]|uniref:C2 domain-containing protein n=1 Tax=Athelia psychrophila TaxID=1759441 RepID=A0A165XQP3_9AGAM|nr:hypothetical protein FIBSPDRAFT_938814 [Fibularhizoctonia sp. CBS 109695]